MDIYNIIKEMSDDKIKEFVHNLINKYTLKFKDSNESENYIGMNLDINHDDNLSSKEGFDLLFEMHVCWEGFIPLGTKIIYGFCKENDTVCNMGMYYYVDDDSYLYEFFKHIKNEKIETDEKLIIKTFYFIYNFLGDNKYLYKERSDIHALLLDHNGKYIRPIKEHSIKDFYYNGSGKCTEYALLVQNILCMLGYDTYYVLNESHAFNIFKLKDTYYLYDASCKVPKFDLTSERQTSMPYLIPIDDMNDDTFTDYINGDKDIDAYDFFFVKMNNSSYPICNDQKRVYSIKRRFQY